MHIAFDVSAYIMTIQNVRDKCKKHEFEMTESGESVDFTLPVALFGMPISITTRRRYVPLSL